MAAPRPAWIEAAVGGACYRELILPVRSIFGTGDPWSRMLAFYSIYKAYFRAALMLQFQYRIAMLIWLLGGVIEPLMYLVVWRTVAQQQGGSVGGYSVNDFVVYFIATMMVSHGTFTWIMWEYVYRIRMGLFSVMLLKPIHPIHSDIADNIGYKFLTLVVMVPISLLLAWFFEASWQPTIWSLAAFVPVLILAFLMRFYWEWALAMVAFWTTRIDAMNQAYIVTTLFFSGRLAPLDLFPQVVQRVADFLPFRWMLAFPVELLLGRVTPRELLMGLGAQLFWLFAGYLFMQLIYRAGIKRYAAFGG